jgi:hypothetical protein
MQIQIGGVLKMKIKNWSKFQHFKDRRPPWIKLYRDLLDDMEWHQLDPLASKVLVTLWLLASEDQNGCLPDTKTLAWRMRMTEKQILDCISKLSHWLEHDDNGVISERYQDDLPERETETETKRETKKNATVVACPPDVGEQVWQDWLSLRKAKKAPVTETVLNSAKKEAVKAGISLNAFLTIWCARGSQGLEADWLKTHERQTFAQQVADIARTTVPPQHAGRDPVLIKIEQDRLKAVPPSLETLAKMAALKKLA